VTPAGRPPNEEELPPSPSSQGGGSDESRLLTVPNVLSALRLALVPFFVWLFVSGREEAAVLLYGIGASTDWLDGYIARRTGQITELGRLLDPLADRIYIAALVVALTIRGVLPLWLAVGVVGRDALLLALFPLVDRKTTARLRVNFTGKTATASLLVGLTCLALSETSLGGRPWEQIGFFLVVVGFVLYWISGIMYAGAARSSVGVGRGAG
jgi:cardiolipin synthase (CMP-forming)